MGHGVIASVKNAYNECSTLAIVILMAGYTLPRRG